MENLFAEYEQPIEASPADCQRLANMITRNFNEHGYCPMTAAWQQAGDPRIPVVLLDLTDGMPDEIKNSTVPSEIGARAMVEALKNGAKWAAFFAEAWIAERQFDTKEQADEFNKLCERDGVAAAGGDHSECVVVSYHDSTSQWSCSANIIRQGPDRPTKIGPWRAINTTAMDCGGLCNTHAAAVTETMNDIAAPPSAN